ncbi:uncharacterized protein ACNS7B_024515 [Menidia menidia]
MASFLLVLSLLLLPGAGGFQDGEETLCFFTGGLKGAEPDPTNELRGVLQQNGTIRCSRGSRCYGLWERRPGGGGCWMDAGPRPRCGAERCVLDGGGGATGGGAKGGGATGGGATGGGAKGGGANYSFCCCRLPLCNANYSQAPPTAAPPALSRRQQPTGHPLRPRETALVALVTVAVAAILIVALFLGYRLLTRRQKLSEAGVEAAPPEDLDLDGLQLLELIGRGRHGSVFRGLLGPRPLAVKLFGWGGRRSFSSECAAYRLLRGGSPHVARFLGGHARAGPQGRPEFLLLLEYCPRGSLSGFLSQNVVDWPTCCRMLLGATRGLAFLHTEQLTGDVPKPPLAHRDLCGRNVLLRADLSCVLADFSLAMRLSGPRAPGEEEAIPEVGTLRYMAPEVLGGALNLRDCAAALKQVDVYALGLLYWESFRRCSDLFPDEAVPDFQLAFQAELGTQPTFQDMRDLVVRQRLRPAFPEAWKQNSLVLRFLKETMEDCWDQDAEARLTAQCAEERLSELAALSTHTGIHNHRNLSPGSCCIQDLQEGVVRNLQEGVVRNLQEGVVRNLQEGVVRNPQEGVVRNPQEGVVRNLQEGVVRNPQEGVVRNLQEGVVRNLQEGVVRNLQADGRPEGPSGAEVSGKNSNCINYRQQQNLPPPKQQNLPPPKQQNLPPRPTSLQLLPRAQRSGSVSSRLGKSKHRQVETGVAKMDALTTVPAAEPQLVTTVTNLHAAPPLASIGSPGGPFGPAPGHAPGHALLAFSPDENQPLLASEQPPDQSDPPHPGPKIQGGGPQPGVYQPGGEPRTSRDPEPRTSQEPEPRTSQEPEPRISQGPEPRTSRDPEPRRGAGDETGRAEPAPAASEPEPEPQSPGSEPEPPLRRATARRPERPCSLDLSCISSGGLSSCGQKIKRRVKTPYALKKLRPASWVLSAHPGLDPVLQNQRAAPPPRDEPVQVQHGRVPGGGRGHPDRDLRPPRPDPLLRTRFLFCLPSLVRALSGILRITQNAVLC